MTEIENIGFKFIVIMSPNFLKEWTRCKHLFICWTVDCNIKRALGLKCKCDILISIYCEKKRFCEKQTLCLVPSVSYSST